MPGFTGGGGGGGGGGGTTTVNTDVWVVRWVSGAWEAGDRPASAKVAHWLSQLGDGATPPPVERIAVGDLWFRRRGPV